MPTWITGGASIAEPEVLAYSESESNDGGSVTLRCQWEERWATVNNIFDYALFWPYLPGTAWVPTSFTMTGVQGIRTGVEAGEELNTYEKADIVLQFGDPDSGEKREQGTAGYPGGSTDHTALYYESFAPSGEMLKIPPYIPKSYMFTWEDNEGLIAATAAPAAITNYALDADEAPTRLIIGVMYQVRWVGLDEIPDAFFDSVDHVNAEEIVSSVGRTFAPETLLCQSPTISRVVSADGSTSKWECEARFAYRRDGWNKWYNPKTNTFQEIYRYLYDDASGRFGSKTAYKNFPTSEFTGMMP